MPSQGELVHAKSKTDDTEIFYQYDGLHRRVAARYFPSNEEITYFYGSVSDIYLVTQIYRVHWSGQSRIVNSYSIDYDMRGHPLRM